MKAVGGGVEKCKSPIEKDDILFKVCVTTNRHEGQLPIGNVTAAMEDARELPSPTMSASAAWHLHAENPQRSLIYRTLHIR